MAVSCTFKADVKLWLQKLDIVGDAINDRIAKYKKDPAQDGLQAIKDWALQMLETTGLAYYERVPPQFCGVWPGNRGGAGLVSAHMAAVVDSIVLFGWSWKQTAMACAGEIAPSDTSVQEFNEQLHEMASGYLGDVTETLTRQVLECGHTTAGLNAVRTGAIAMHGTIADVNGKLSLARLQERPQCKEHVNAIEIGLNYLVIRHQVQAKCPGLYPIISKAGNLAAETHQAESLWQSLQIIHKYATSMPTPTQGEIKAMIASMMPRYADAADDLLAFVQCWSGGADGALLKSVSDFIKVTPHQRDIPTSILGAFAKVSLREAPVYVEACMMAMFNQPAGKHVEKGSNSVRLFTTTDVANISDKLRPFVLDASKILKQARQTIAALGNDIDMAQACKVLGDLDTRIVMRVHGKDGKKYDSFAHIGYTFWQELEAIVGPGVLRACPWPAPAARDGARAQRSGLVMQELRDGQRDQITRGLNKLGLVVDATCILKSDGDAKSVFTIKECVEDAEAGSTYIIKSDSKEERVSAAALLDNYKLYEDDSPKDCI